MSWKRLALSFLLLVALAAGGVHWRASLNERAAARDFPPQGQLLQVNGLTVHAVIKGQGPDLVLIHGSSGNTRDFTLELFDRLASDYRVIAFDRPGLGWSDALPRGAEGIHDQAAQLRAAALQLGADKPILLGQSYGAAVALAWALDAPDNTAAVVNVSGPSHPWPGPMSRYYRVISNPVGAALVVPMITAFVGPERVEREIAAVFSPQSLPDGYADHIAAPLILRRDALRANARHRALLKDEIIALESRYADFPVPLEIVHGAADEIVSLTLHANQMLQATDQARLTALPGIGHMPHHVAQDAVIAAINRAATRAGLR